jgi:phenylalanyl-tRNA synthetase alpha subunit
VGFDRIASQRKAEALLEQQAAMVKRQAQQARQVFVETFRHLNGKSAENWACLLQFQSKTDKMFHLQAADATLQAQRYFLNKSNFVERLINSLNSFFEQPRGFLPWLIGNFAI